MPVARTPLQPAGLRDVVIDDGFWRPRIETNRRTTIPHEYRMCDKTGRIAQYDLDWKPGEPNPPHIFWDSDVAKWIEAAACSLATHPDADLERHLDEVIEKIAGAQHPDGYLNPHYTVVEPGNRWTNLRDCHELYCAGHMIEAAVAHFAATGKRNLLDVLCRFAGHIDATFGPGKRKGYPGHEEIELALVKLYRATGQQRYLKLAEYFINERGSQPHVFAEEARSRGEDPAKWRWGGDFSYCQAHLPVREQTETLGHAVRAMYLYSGMADVARETQDEALLAACRRLWEDVTTRKMYVTGGVGSSAHGETFTKAYDLPNEAAYAETCAAIGLVFFAHRMLQIERNAHYADVMERALYNGVLSGVGLDGKTFFYVNPLASRGDHHRREWFGTSCCPPNIARLLASLGQYAYSTADNAVYVHLYVAGQVHFEMQGQEISLQLQTRYPWDAKIRLSVQTTRPMKFDLMLRIPGWCRRHSIKVNGRPASTRLAKGYARISRRWASGDRVSLTVAMPVERVISHPFVEADAGKVALMRGPIVYCLEQCDHEVDVRSIALPDRAKLAARFDEKVAGGATVIETTGRALPAAAWKGRLYQPIKTAGRLRTMIKAIPYCLWDNRKAGPMTVWMMRNA